MPMRPVSRGAQREEQDDQGARTRSKGVGVMASTEAVQRAKIRELAGDAADYLESATKGYPKPEADAVQTVLDAGRIAVVAIDEQRATIYQHGGAVHAIVMRPIQGGYRRGFAKITAPTTAEVLAELTS
jgi:hypothetical protein